MESAGALEVVTTVERNANGCGFGRAVACCECTRRGIGAQSGQGRAYGTSGTRRRITAVSLSFRHCRVRRGAPGVVGGRRSEEHTSELQSLMSISYAVFCLKKNM